MTTNTNREKVEALLHKAGFYKNSDNDWRGSIPVVIDGVLMPESIIYHVFLQDVDYGSGMIKLRIVLQKNAETLDIPVDNFIKLINHQFKHNIRKDKIGKLLNETI